MLKLTDKDYAVIKSLALRIFNDKAIKDEQNFIAMCYTEAVLSFLCSKGLINETIETKTTKD